jgi:hypothetical protein
MSKCSAVPCAANVEPYIALRQMALKELNEGRSNGMLPFNAAVS